LGVREVALLPAQVARQVIPQARVLGAAEIERFFGERFERRRRALQIVRAARREIDLVELERAPHALDARKLLDQAEPAARERRCLAVREQTQAAPARAN